MRSFTAELGNKASKGQQTITQPATSPEQQGLGVRNGEQGFVKESKPKPLPTPTQRRKCNATPEIVVIGTSLGGLHALEVLLSGLPKSFPLPVAIAQHRHKDSDDSLRIFLQHQCVLPILEPEDKEAISPGRVYLAPADYHLLVETGFQGGRQNGHTAVTPAFALSTDAPVSYARPSIDALFESAADAYGEKAIGVILTGASSDGTQGVLKIKACGGKVIVQEPTTAECATMPKAAICALQQRYEEHMTVDWILPLSGIAPFIVNLCHPAPRSNHAD